MLLLMKLDHFILSAVSFLDIPSCHYLNQGRSSVEISSLVPTNPTGNQHTVVIPIRINYQLPQPRLPVSNSLYRPEFPIYPKKPGSIYAHINLSAVFPCFPPPGPAVQHPPGLVHSRFRPAWATSPPRGSDLPLGFLHFFFFLASRGGSQ